jgi:hypothetical protein
MKTRVLLLMTAVSALVLMGVKSASAQIPWCPPFCVAKAEPKPKAQQEPKAQKQKKQKKIKKERA